MPRAFKAPRLKRNFSATGKKKHHPLLQKFWKATNQLFFFFFASRHGNSPSEGIAPFRESKRRRWRRRNQNADKACSSNSHPSNTARDTGVLFSHAVTAHQEGNPQCLPNGQQRGLLRYFKQSEVSQLMEDRAIGPQLFLIDWNDGWS